MQRKNWGWDHFYHDTEKNILQTYPAGLHSNWTNSLSKIAFLGFCLFACFLAFLF